MNPAGKIEQIANAILYEGFLLYPYRQSSIKNRHRWHFGVLYPEPFAGANGERNVTQTECLLEADATATLSVKIRFLQITGELPVEREVLVADQPLARILDASNEIQFSFPALNGKLELSVRKLDATAYRVTVRIYNLARIDAEDRDAALAVSFVSTHVLMAARGGRFISLIDPPEAFKAAVADCRNDGLWPVLVGGGDVQMLAAPIILEDHPRIAPQSAGDLFDGTEIDEILTMRVLTLTDDEKSEMRGGDPRTRSILERSEALSQDQLSQLHATMHPVGEAGFTPGDRVRLRPHRRADIFDVVLAGKLATVISVEHDFEDRVHLCVVVDDDPGRDLGQQGKPGHRFFFAPDEVERS